MVVTLLITLALSGLVLSAIIATTTETRLSSNHTMEEKTFYLAERGVEESIATLAAMGTPLVGSGDDGNDPVPLFEGKETSDGKFSAWADPMDSSTGKRTRFVSVTVRGILEGVGVSKAIRVELGQQNFSRFAYFSDVETLPNGSPIWFTSQDEFFGPVHTNDDLHIYGDPVFHEEVSSSGESVVYYHGGPPQDNPVFEDGLELGVAEIPLPDNTDLLKAMAMEPDGHYLVGNTVEVEMLPVGGVGKMVVRIDGGAAVTYDIPANGVTYVEGNVQMWGTLLGQMTLATSGDIEIMDDIVYDNDPRVDPLSTDLLGLVAEGNVFMDGDPHGNNFDLGSETVMAAIMALDESWTVEDWNLGSPRGNLTVYGGIIQKRRGPVGTFNPWTNQVVTGYTKDYSYDMRLMDTPPPYFPTTGEIDKISWREIDPSMDIAMNYW